MHEFNSAHFFSFPTSLPPPYYVGGEIETKEGGIEREQNMLNKTSNFNPWVKFGDTKCLCHLAEIMTNPNH